MIRKIQPEAVILVTAIHDGPDRKIVRTGAEGRGKLDLVNLWVYHPYAAEPRLQLPGRREDEGAARIVQPKYKVYQGEVGCPSIWYGLHALANYPWTEYSQAKWDLRRMAGDRVRGIDSRLSRSSTLKYTNMQQSFGLIRSNLLLQFIYKRPVYYAVQHMAASSTAM